MIGADISPWGPSARPTPRRFRQYAKDVAIHTATLIYPPIPQDREQVLTSLAADPGSGFLQAIARDVEITDGP